MLKKTFAAALVIGATLAGTQGQALAIEAVQDHDWIFMMSRPGMDADRDGMVSRQEFLDAMARAYDVKSRVMKADPRGLSQAQLDGFLRSLYVGG